MKRQIRSTSRAGFTLIEVLVTLILVSLLAAAVFPVITQQIGAADAPRLASDLSSLRSGIELFNANVRTFPGDLEDLVNKPSSTATAGDIAIVNSTTATDYYESKHVVRWDGPYVDLSLQVDDDGNSAEDVVNNLGNIESPLTCVNASATSADPVGVACANNSGHFVAVQLTDFKISEFAKLNDNVDPSEDGTTSTGQWQGKLRCDVSGTDCATVFYLVSPYVAR